MQAIIALLLVAIVAWSMFPKKNKIDTTISRILDGTPNHNRRSTDKGN